MSLPYELHTFLHCLYHALSAGSHHVNKVSVLDAEVLQLSPDGLKSLGGEVVRVDLVDEVVADLQVVVVAVQAELPLKWLDNRVQEWSTNNVCHS